MKMIQPRKCYIIFSIFSRVKLLLSGESGTDSK
jgi:hypothetical protein